MKYLVLAPPVLLLCLGLLGCSDALVDADVASDAVQFSSADPASKTIFNACWGQASAVFAQMGAMGEHSSQQPNPRVGLRNLARALYEAGVIPDDSMQALGVFVTYELGLSIEACTTGS